MAITKLGFNINNYINNNIKNARTLDENDPEAMRAYYQLMQGGRAPKYFYKFGPATWKLAPHKYMTVHTDNNDPYMQWQRAQNAKQIQR